MKKGIIIIVPILIVGIIISVLIFKLSKSPSSESQNSEQKINFEKYLESAVNEINEINKILTSEKVSEMTAYENDLGFKCKKYIGEDKETFITKLKELYEIPFTEMGYFELIESEEESTTNELYVCLPDECKPKVYDYKTATIEYDEKDKKIVNFTGTEFVINFIDNKWKFEIPAVSCPLNQDLLEITE